MSIHIVSYIPGRGQAPIHFKEETISLCHPERSEGSLTGQRSFAALRMTLLNRLRLTRNTSYLKCIGPCGRPSCPRSIPKISSIYAVDNADNNKNSRPYLRR